MKLISLLTASLGLVSLVASSYTDVQIKIALDNKFNGATCGAVEHSKGKKSSINFYIEEITGIENLKIPFAVFRYRDIVNYENFPTLDSYMKSYSNGDKARSDLYKGLVDFESNKFIISESSTNKREDGSKASNVYTDYLSFVGDNQQPEALFEVEESGIYCIYLAPPLEEGLEFSIPVRYQSSTGYLSPTDYKMYSTTRWFSFFGILLFGYLFYYILRFKTDKNFANMDNISFISKGIIFYVLFPIVVLQLTIVFFNSLMNNFGPSDKINPVLDIMLSVTYWGASCFGAVILYFVLLFAMGFGVIYYNKGTSRNYRTLPDGHFKKANILLLLNLGAISLEYVVSILSKVTQLKERKTNPFFDPLLRGILNPLFPQLLTLSMSGLGNILAFISGLISIIITVYTIYHYFVTKKVISKFPVIEDASVLERITKSFRYSILVIFVLPIFIGIGGGILAGYRMASQSVDFNNLPVTGPINNMPQSRVQSIMLIMISENLIFNNLSFELTFVSGYITIVCIYFIWIKDNNGLIINKEDFSEFSYADDESSS